jgi:hypothetical protein
MENLWERRWRVFERLPAQMAQNSKPRMPAERVLLAKRHLLGHEQNYFSIFFVNFAQEPAKLA